MAFIIEKDIDASDRDTNRYKVYESQMREKETRDGNVSILEPTNQFEVGGGRGTMIAPSLVDINLLATQEESNQQIAQDAHDIENDRFIKRIAELNDIKAQIELLEI